MRRLATTLNGVAFLWSCAATGYLLSGAGYGVDMDSSLASSGAEIQRITLSLASADGPWVAGLLIGVSLVAGMPLGVALAYPKGQTATTWTAGLLLLGFCMVSGFSVGLLYLPGAVLLVVSAILTAFTGSVERPMHGRRGAR